MIPTSFFKFKISAYILFVYFYRNSSYNPIRVCAMNNGNLAWQDSSVHRVLGSDIPCMEQDVAIQM